MITQLQFTTYPLTVQTLARASDLLADLAMFYHARDRPAQSTKCARLANLIHSYIDPTKLEQAAAIAGDYGQRVLTRDYWLLLKFYETEQIT